VPAGDIDGQRQNLTVTANITTLASACSSLSSYQVRNDEDQLLYRMVSPSELDSPRERSDFGLLAAQRL
jgi:hypothetical protein